ncbi:MAG: mCpol domain-containing protein [Candidatus Nanoarchaeia archaeon]|nr:mCpol domain-containing protein [Candidatus Nanoarchaeia archaeon]
MDQNPINSNTSMQPPVNQAESENKVDPVQANMVFITFNGDNVGDKIGNTIKENDHEGLFNLSNTFKNSNIMLSKWIEGKKGRVIAESGDEVIGQIPQEAKEELENLKSQYEQQAGTTLTIGLGSSLSEAFKALIYGKLSNKNQIVEYDPSIDEFINQGSQEEEEVNPENISQQANENVSNPNNELPIPSKGSDELSQVPTQPKPYESNPISQKTPEEIQENKAIQTSEQGAIQNKDNPNIEEAPGKSDITNENEPTVEDEGTVDKDIPELSNEEILNDSSDGTQVPSDNAQVPSDDNQQPSNEQDGMVGNMIQGQMEDGDNEQDNAELKANIAEALLAFRENKDILEQAKVENPKLYQATISMLRSMIMMAKQLNLGSSDKDVESEGENEEAESEEVENEKEGKDKEAENQPSEIDEKIPSKESNKEDTEPPVKKK